MTDESQAKQSEESKVSRFQSYSDQHPATLVGRIAKMQQDLEALRKRVEELRAAL